MSAAGTRTLTVVVPRQRAPRVPALAITVTAGPDRGLRVTATEPLILVGRAEGAQVRLSDATVSQFHLELEAGPDGVELADLGSHNGTRIGGVVLRQARVPFGGEVTLGSTSLRLDAEGEVIAEAAAEASFGELVGWSTPMRQVYAQLARLAVTDLSVLLEGETGTGKELAARGLHDASRRAAQPFVVLDCTSIPPELAESVLFGHQRGAFTGADETRIGMVQAAQGGTLFLDEIGELPLALQPKLLRVLERRQVVPVGTTQPRDVDIRLVSASFRDLRAMINAGTFREDLYYRLAQARVRLPSLAERPEDLRPLAQHFLASLPPSVRAARSIDADALEALVARPFAGNVRELRGVVERLALLAEGATVTLDDVVMDRMLATGRKGSLARASAMAARAREDAAATPPTVGDEAIEPFKVAKRTVVDEFERAYLAKLLARAGTNISRAAALAGIERQSLRDLLERHGLRGEG
jgi:DNA-binding NtrC family response regulator